MKNSQGVSKPVLLCILMMVAWAAVSCQGPEANLHTVEYHRRYRPIPIATRGRAQPHQLIEFFTAANPSIGIERISAIARTYIDEAAAEGVNSDVAFCQMMHETNDLRFGGDVRRWQNNFCGLGATGRRNPGLSFPSMQIGIRAHIQHLKAYACTRPLRGKLVDPRFGKVRRGRAPFVDDLSGTWATDPLYGAKIRLKLRAL